VLKHDWLSPGAHVNAVGASTPNAHEIEPETFAAATVVADSRESVENEAGEFRLARERNLNHDIAAELGEVIIGAHSGRTSASELTVFRSLGLAVEDLAAARLAVDTARERGIGTEVEL
jgi:ornithine cyclodeaminase/alanine dehydrogenase-like protein (mu-crystallin family)